MSVSTLMFPSTKVRQLNNPQPLLLNSRGAFSMVGNIRGWVMLLCGGLGKIGVVAKIVSGAWGEV